MMDFFKPILFWLDDQRLHLHFRTVERVLKARDVSHLPQSLQQVRAQNLDQLHVYATHGIFPRNHDRPGWTPCFIDRSGRECAVAHLVIQSGHTDAARHIAYAANNASIFEMNFPELDTWTDESGFTKAELALIQPSYIDPELIGRYSHLAFSAGFGWIWAAAIGLFTLVALILNAVPISLPRLKRIGIGVALGLSVIMISLAFLQIWDVVDGYFLLQRVANLQPPMLDAEVTLARAAYPALIVQTLISLILALVASIFSVKRWQKFKRLSVA